MNQHVNSDTMKQWALREAGAANLSLDAVAKPTPGAGEVVVKVAAVSLNYRDHLHIENGWGIPEAGALIPGSDASGTVVEIGAGSNRFKVGDRVITTFNPGWIDGPNLGNAREPNSRALGDGANLGVLSQYLMLSEDWLVRAPQSLTHEQASTLPCAGLTAWTALVEQGGVKPGQTVVLQGTGGVAMFGLQIAQAFGAETISISGEDEKLVRAKALGASHIVNRKKEDWVEAVYKITGDRGADHILEMVGGAHVARSAQAAAVGGRIALIGVLEGFDFSASLPPILQKNLVLQGVLVGHRRGLEDFVNAIDRHELKPVIDAEYDFADLPSALDHLKRGPFGKIVVKLPE